MKERGPGEGGEGECEPTEQQIYKGTDQNVWTLFVTELEQTVKV